MVTVKTKSGVDQQTLMTRLAAYGDTAYVARDVLGTWAFHPYDPLYNSTQRSNLGFTNIESGWDYGRGDPSNVIIGIIDTGIHCLHEDFKPTALTTRCDSRSPDTLDPIGHGTMAAGVAAAIINNTKGIAGVSNSTLFPLTVATQSMEFVLSDVVFQIMNALSLGFIDVLSFSGTFQINCGDNFIPTNETACTPLKYAVENATEEMVFAAAVGNNNADCPAPFTQEGYVGYPAAYPEVLAVGGSSDLHRWADNVSSGSNCGPEVDVLAPGSAIMTTIPEINAYPGCGVVKYCVLSGTSVATPFVAGLAALVLAKCPSLTPQQVVDLIQDNALHLGTAELPVEDDEQGHGLVQVDDTLGAASC